MQAMDLKYKSKVCSSIIIEFLYANLFKWIII